MPRRNESFTFVLIPSDESQPVTELQASKEGGLTDDALIQHAKSYFHERTGSLARAATLEQAGPSERQILAAQIRQQMQSTGGAGIADRLNAMDDDTVLDMIYKSQVEPSCDIVALTIPTAINDYTACSLYAADSAKQHGWSVNARATALLTACGHAAADGGVYGDVFVGRAKDNETTDVWERTDFGAMDADPGSDWCRIARSSGGGGGSGRAAASSLSDLVNQSQRMNGGDGLQQPMQVINTSGTGSANFSFGMNGAPAVPEPWGSWTQTVDEVELKFAVAAGTKAKYCKVQFGCSSLKVSVAGQTLLQGTTFDPVSLDECTFTLQDEGPTGRELCVTLGKAETGRTWAFVVR